VLVIAFANKAGPTMEAATDTAKKVLGAMIEAGAVDADSIHPHTGEVFGSF
jgi:hypothetical protein